MIKKSIRTRKNKFVSSRRKSNPNAAGIDLGATVHYAAVPAERDPEPVRHFGTLTEDLEALADWLKACAITTVAMEATGVYWIPLFQILEDLPMPHYGHQMLQSPVLASHVPAPSHPENQHHKQYLQ